MNWDATLSNVPRGWTNNRIHFFKYMSESTAKAVLRNQTLRWSTAATLNDPFEMQLNVTIEGIDVDKVKKRALEKIWELYSSDQQVPIGNQLGVALEFMRINYPGMSKRELLTRMSGAIDESFDVIRRNTPRNQSDVMEALLPIKILSLTVAPDISLMWSHYSNSHRGVVMRFRSISAFDSPFGMAKPIVYTDVRPSFFTESYLINSLAGLESINNREMTDAIIYTKMSDWTYEKEWRISSGHGRNKAAPFEDIRFGINELDGIIYGIQMSDGDKAEILDLSADYPNIELMQAIPIQARGKVGIQNI